MRPKKPIEQKIVDALIKDLQNRRFLDHVFADPQTNGEANTMEGMDQETFNELKATWAKIIRKWLEKCK
jgi:hypothetical protein